MLIEESVMLSVFTAFYFCGSEADSMSVQGEHPTSDCHHCRPVCFMIEFLLLKIFFHTVSFDYNFPPPNPLRAFLLSHPPSQIHALSFSFIRIQTGISNNNNKKTPKMPLNLFCTGHLLLGTVWLSGTLLEKTNLCVCVCV